jgi:hypothetical protein
MDRIMRQIGMPDRRCDSGSDHIDYRGRKRSTPPRGPARLPEVTVCIPAYRSAAFIAHTLHSVRAQTFSDFVVDIALEPVDPQPTIAACRPFLEDERFRLRVNPARLGWDGNIQSLLSRIETPTFVVLPHDDAWHPRYLESLVDALRARPDASVAFSDVYHFGDAVGLRWMDLPDADPSQRLIAFFLAGGLAVPWRGVARSWVLDRPFPSNEFDGFSAEFEWALHLVVKGAALRVPQPFYLKRARKEEDSVSTGWRTGMPEARLRAALEHHRAAILGRVTPSDPASSMAGMIEPAAEAALLGRWVGFVDGRFDLTVEQAARADRLMHLADEDHLRVAGAVRSRARLALSRHLVLHRHDRSGAIRLAEEAVRDDPDSWEAHAQLARLYLRDGRPLDALPAVIRAGRLAPMAAGLRRLEAACADRLVASFPDTGSAAT